MDEVDIRVDFRDVASAKEFLDDLSDSTSKELELKIPRTKGFNQDASWVEFVLVLFKYGATVSGPVFAAYLKSRFDKSKADQAAPKSIILKRGQSKLEVDLEDGLTRADKRRIEKFLSDEKD